MRMKTGGTKVKKMRKIKMTLDEIQELLHQALSSDLEHGVAWLNERASMAFHKDYPELCNAIEIIMNYSTEEEVK